jgi:hypothetical protein
MSRCTTTAELQLQQPRKSKTKNKAKPFQEEKRQKLKPSSGDCV